MAALIKEKPFSDISINEITEKADINRSTFYRYYSNKEEWLEDYVEKLLDQPAKLCKSVKYPFYRKDIINLVIKIFEHFNNHKKEIQIIKDPSCYGLFTRKLDEIIEDVVREKLNYPGITNINPFLKSSFIVSGTSGVVLWWITCGMNMNPEIIAENLANLYSAIITREKNYLNSRKKR